MAAFLVALGYTAVALAMIRFAYADKESWSGDETERRAFSTVFGVFWPLSAALLAVIGLGKLLGKLLFRETKQEKLARLETEKKKQAEDALLQLERDAPELLDEASRKRAAALREERERQRRFDERIRRL